jgi:hypothetical protein
MSGTVYVARGHGGSALKARKGMQDVLDAGLPVVFFPEGTTSNGSGLLKFHSGLLAQVLHGNSPVTAAYMRYSFAEENGPGVTVSNNVCYWGDRNMLAHIFRFLGLRGVRAEVRCFRTRGSTENWPLSKQGPLWRPWGRKAGDQKSAPFLIQRMFICCEHCVTKD